jgi:hypothetical protein
MWVYFPHHSILDKSIVLLGSFFGQLYTSVTNVISYVDILLILIALAILSLICTSLFFFQ